MSKKKVATQSQEPSVFKVPGRITAAENALHANPVDIEAIREAARGQGGLVERRLRKEAWPKLLGINMFTVNEYTGPPLNSHHDYRQVKLDVDRSVRRFPSSFTEDQVAKMQEEMTHLILRLLQENPDIHYYQGLHDIVVTFLIEVGAKTAYAILTVLVHHQIRDFMDTDMERTKHLISFLPTLLSLADREVGEFITRSTCNYYFCLSCLITWYGHEVDDHSVVVRLTDLFLATHPMMPLYLSAAIIILRREEVLSVECELSEVHSLLVRIPSDLDWEGAVERALQLFTAHPPHKVATKRRPSYRRSTTFNCYGKIQQRTKKLLPDHILKINPYADQESLLLLPWREKRRIINVLFVLSPILISVAYWWWSNTHWR